MNLPVFRLLAREIGSRWAVYLLTVSLVALAVAFLSAQGSLNSSAQEEIEELTHRLGDAMLVLPQGTDLAEFYRMRYGEATMPQEYAQRLRDSHLGKHIRQIEPALYGNITVGGVEAILLGRNFRFPSGGGGEPVALGAGLARRLGLARGDTLELGGRRLQIISVVEPAPKGYDMAVFAPLQTAQAILGRPGRINALHLSGCWCELDVAGLTAQVESSLPGTMAITVEGMAKAHEEIKATMEHYRAAFWGGGAVLVSASVAFLLLYLLHKGKREIGLLLSIGVSPRGISVRNAIVSLGIVIVGTLAGYLLSIPLMAQAGLMFMKVKLSPSLEVLPWLLALSMGAALLASLIPALHISRLDPTRLLREE
jgi:hypothetical protein